jgi:iron complex outermembrane recepter protein
VQTERLQNIVSFGGAKMSKIGYVALALLGGPFCAQAQTQQSANEEVVEEVVVVGSAIRNRSVESDTAALPIQYITIDQFENTPAESVADFLHELPITGQSVSRYTNEHGGGSSSLNLRGIGDQYTLVLVDGRRFGGEDLPDIGALPPEAIQGVEILKTGSSAIYGSDAVAGVVNIRLRKDFQGLELFASYGRSTVDESPHPTVANYEDIKIGGQRSGDAANIRFGALFGFEADKLSYTGSLSYQENDGFERADRTITATRDFRPWGGHDGRSTFYGAPHRIRLLDGPMAGEQFSVDLDRFEPGYVPTDLGDFVAYDQERQGLSAGERAIAPPFQRISSHWAVDYEFSDRVNLYSRGYIDWRQQDFFTHEPRMTETMQVAADNPHNMFGVDAEVFYSFDPERHGYMTSDFETLNVQGTVGLEGSITERWEYDVGVTSYRKGVRDHYINDPIPALAQALVDSGEFNPFCYRCVSDDLFDQMIAPAGAVRDTVNKSNTADATISGDLFDWGQHTVQAAIGYQYRYVEASFRPDSTWQTTDFGWRGGPSEADSDSRSVNAYFVEVLVPLYDADDDAAITSAEISGAIRNETYSDFGGATVSQLLGKVGLFGEQLIVRAGIAESFRAPTVEDLTDPTSTSTNVSGFWFDPVRDEFGALDFINGGNPNLEPEEGESLNLGVIVRPNALPELFLSLDYWSLEIDGIIRSPDIQSLLNGTETAGSVTRDPVTLYPTVDTRPDNGGIRKMSGFDMSSTYLFETGIGELSLYANASYLTKFEESAAGATLYYLETWTRNQGGVPKLRTKIGVDWQYNALDASVGMHYYSSYRDVFESLNVDREVGSQTEMDVQVGYNFADKGRSGPLSGLRVFLGVENVFNERPKLVFSSADGWDRFYGDLRGRYVYGGAKLAF